MNNLNNKQWQGYQQHNNNPYLQKQSQQISCVIEAKMGVGGLYVGTIEAAKNVQLLQKHKIQNVLTLCHEEKFNYKINDLISHLVLQCQDVYGFNIRQFFNQTYKFIDEARESGNVLVHCMAGLSRSPCIVLSYMMVKMKLNLEQALIILKHARPESRPNPGFLKELLRLERDLQGQITSKLNAELTPYFGVQSEPQYLPQQPIRQSIQDSQQLVKSQRIPSPYNQQTVRNIQNPNYPNQIKAYDQLNKNLKSQYHPGTYQIGQNSRVVHQNLKVLTGQGFVIENIIQNPTPGMLINSIIQQRSVSFMTPASKGNQNYLETKTPEKNIQTNQAHRYNTPQKLNNKPYMVSGKHNDYDYVKNLTVNGQPAQADNQYMEAQTVPFSRDVQIVRYPQLLIQK